MSPDNLSAKFNCALRISESEPPEPGGHTHKLDVLRREVKRLLAGDSDAEVGDLPDTYELYDDLVLLPSDCLRKLGENQVILNLICDIFRDGAIR